MCCVPRQVGCGCRPLIGAGVSCKVIVDMNNGTGTRGSQRPVRSSCHMRTGLVVVMRKVYEAAQVFEAEEVRLLLEEHAITAFVFGEHTYSSPGVNPLAWPSVWIDEDEDFERAKALVGEYEAQKRQRDNELHNGTADTWRCRRCGETNEGTFAVCWNCGTAGGGR